MMNKQEPIKNLKDLRRAKRRLKLEMNSSEIRNDNSSLISKATGLITNSFMPNRSITSSGVENALRWVGNKTSKKYPMKGFSKILISGLIMILVPIISNRIQKYIRDKFF